MAKQYVYVPVLNSAKNEHRRRTYNLHAARARTAAAFAFLKCAKAGIPMDGLTRELAMRACPAYGKAAQVANGYWVTHINTSSGTP